jgi:hypothetical protein
MTTIGPYRLPPSSTSLADHPIPDFFADCHRTVVRTQRPLNPPPAFRVTTSLAQEAAPDPRTDRRVSTIPSEAVSVVPAAEEQFSSPYADQLTEPLKVVLDNALKAGRLPSISNIVDVVLPYIRTHVTAPSTEVHDYICSLYPPQHRVLAETVALAIKRVAVDNQNLHDVIHRYRLDLMAKDRQIAELERKLNSDDHQSALNADLDVFGSDREFD